MHWFNIRKARPELKKLVERGIRFTDPFDVISFFEKALSKYTGAPEVVVTDSATHALELCLRLSHRGETLQIPCHTYPSVPMTLNKLNIEFEWEDRQWEGIYQLKPLPLFDCALRFKKNMYIPGTMQCLSFHIKKHLPIGRGGAILLDNHALAQKLRKMVYDGRDRSLKWHNDPITVQGYHYYMPPEDAARGLLLLDKGRPEAEDLGDWRDYPDLRTLPVFERQMRLQSAAETNQNYLCVLMKTAGNQPLKCFRKMKRRLAISTDEKNAAFLEELYPLLKKTDRPWLVINGETDVTGDIDLTDDEIAHLSGKTLSVYLYEPLFLQSDHGDPWNAGCIDAFAPELEGLRRFHLKYDKCFNIKVHSCDYRLDEVNRRQNLYPDFQFVTSDIFCLQRVLMMNRPEMEKVAAPAAFKKRFCCLNYRYEPIRELIVASLFGLGLADRSHISFFHNHDEKGFFHRLPFEIRHWDFWPQIQRGLQNLTRKVPLHLDIENPRAVSSTDQPLPNQDGTSNWRDIYATPPWYEEAFCAVVNESRFDRFSANISEKTLTPISLMRPFILVAPPYSLEYLQSLGFKTFGDFWDESYDRIEDHEQRTYAILQLLQKIGGFNEAEVEKLFQGMLPILQHNYHHLFNEYVSTQIETLLSQKETI